LEFGILNEGRLPVKTLLINPSPTGTLKATGVLFPPLGLLYVAAYAEREGHEVVVRDLAIRKKEKRLIIRNMISWGFQRIRHAIVKPSR